MVTSLRVLTIGWMYGKLVSDTFSFAIDFVLICTRSSASPFSSVREKSKGQHTIHRLTHNPKANALSNHLCVGHTEDRTDEVKQAQRSQVRGPFQGPITLIVTYNICIIRRWRTKVQLFLNVLYYNFVLSSIEFSKISDGWFLLSVPTLVFTRSQH